MINKERLLQTYLVLYMIMVGMISYTAFNSPFMMENYTSFIVINSAVLLASYIYIVDLKFIKAWWRGVISNAELRRQYREDVKKGLKTKYGEYKGK